MLKEDPSPEVGKRPFVRLNFSLLVLLFTQKSQRRSESVLTTHYIFADLSRVRKSTSFRQKLIFKASGQLAQNSQDFFTLEEIFINTHHSREIFISFTIIDQE